MLARYAVAGLAWSVLAACFAAALALSRGDQLARVAPEPVVWSGVALVCLVVFAVPVASVAGPLRERRRSRGP